jgi:hypothetical protein
MVAVAHPTAGGLEVVGHTAAVADGIGRRTPNVVVHFARGTGVDRVAAIARAIAGSQRPNAPTAILVVAPRGGFTGKTLPEGAVYAEEDAAWDDVFGVGETKSSETLIVGPDGRVHWRQAGDVDVNRLAAALKEHLVPASIPQPVVLAATARLGHAPPNFLFEHAPGKQITLRKLSGRPTTIVFWRAASAPSIDAVLELERETAASRGLVIAVNDGDPNDVVTRAAATHKFSAVVVADSMREISAGYGVRVWPTVVSLDSLGVVSSIRYARMESSGTGRGASPQGSASGREKP